MTLKHEATPKAHFESYDHPYSTTAQKETFGKETFGNEARPNQMHTDHPLPPSHASPPGAMSRRVFNLAWPVISENILETMLGIVDTALVGRLGAVALAGVGTAIQFMFFVISALSAVSVGSSVLVAQSVGARSYDRASYYAKQSLVWSVLLSIPLILIGLFAAESLVSIFGTEPEVARIGAQYLRVTMGTVAVLTLLILGGGVLRGAGDSRTPMQVTLLANLVNAVLAYGLIFGKLGLPELGAVGSAWATFIARSVALALLLRAMVRGSNGVSIRGRENWFPEWSAARQILGIGIPAAVEQVLTSVAFLGFSIIVAHLGTGVMAAQRIALNAMSLAFLPGFGFAISATALVGQSIGAKKPAEGAAVARIATWWAMTWMGVLGVVFFFFAPEIMRLFSNDETVIAIGSAGLRVLAFSQPAWAIGMVQGGALRGTGNTQYPLRINVLSIWAAVALSWIGVNYVQPSIVAAWAGFLVTSPISAWLLWHYFQKKIKEA